VRRKKVWRYYCEHCRKSGCSGYHMRRHEEGCTLNPNRICRMCKMVEGEQKPLDVLTAVFDGLPVTEADEYGYRTTTVNDSELQRYIKRLETITDGCPACMLAAARAFCARYDGFRVFIDVGFKKRCESVWSDINAAERERCQHG